MLVCVSAQAAGGPIERIEIYKQNPAYWQYKGKPVLLLGGSKDDNLFQIPDLKEHLNLLASVGGNYIRNTMSSRSDKGFEVQPFKRLSDGSYDLNQWNDEYWDRFERMLKLTRDRDIIVQIEVWAFHDFNKGHWEKNPWRPANNINYDSSNATLKDSYGNIGKVPHGFFFTVPKLNNDGLVLAYQQKFVDKMLSYTLSHNHVLYCMTNEIHPQYSPEWGWYWSKYIKDKAAIVGRQVETTEMYWEIDLKKEQQRASLDHPEIYSYFEASQNSAKRGQENWDNLQFVYKYLAEKQRPINHTKIYGADSCPWEKSTTRHASECFWRNILAGSASSRFHRPPYGMGLAKKAQAHIKSMRLLTAELDIFKAVPDSGSRLLSNRSANEAYLSYIHRKQYAVYFPNGGSVDLDLSEAAGQYVMKWLDITQSKWGRQQAVQGGRKVTLRTPGSGHRVVLLVQEIRLSENENANRIRPYPKNPRYWQYKSKPVLLLGGSKDDNLFQIPDLKEHLNLLASVGGNYIRNTMSARVDRGFEIQAFKRLPDGKYDLNQWNDEYWNRFQNLFRWTGQRDIIVQIEVWDRFDYTDRKGTWGGRPWQINPYNPANNINYTSKQCGLAEAYPDHPSADKQPFFHTIPAMDDNKVLRRYQEAFVDKMLSYSLPCGNVLYCMNNETSTSPIWGQYWMKYIKTKATEFGVDVYVTDMFDVGWELDTEEKFLLSFDKPDIYTFLDISQNTGNKNTFKKHWQNILFVLDRTKKDPRPINNTKNYGSSEWPPNRDYYKRVWRRWTTESAVQRYVLNVIGGCASTRFHRNPIGGIGLTEPAQNCIKALRKLESLVKMWELTPRNDLLTDYEDSKVFLSANPGRMYALFFLEGGSASVDLRGYEGTFMVKWINVRTGEWGKEDEIEANAIVSITSPDERPWLAAVIRKRQQASLSGQGVLGSGEKTLSQKTSGLALHQVPDTSNCHGLNMQNIYVSGIVGVFPPRSFLLCVRCFDPSKATSLNTGSDVKS